jgi:hypothetical protein
MDLLRSLGFVEGQATLYSPPGGLTKNFGNFTLSAIQCISLHFQQIVQLSGVMTTRRSVAQVECELPVVLESREQGIAWVTWCLDSHAHGQFQPTIPTPWLAEGRLNRHLLPWERERAACAARPHCATERAWARLALRTLSQLLAEEADDTPVEFRFDGELLTIRCRDRLIALAASGKRWPAAFALPARALRALPPRLHEQVEFCVQANSLCIASRSCSTATYSACR